MIITLVTPGEKKGYKVFSKDIPFPGMLHDLKDI